MDISRKIFGRSLFRLIMKMTFYGHFVAGENEASIQPLIMRLKKYGVKSILDYSVEKDIQEDEAVQIVKSVREMIFLIMMCREFRPSFCFHYLKNTKRSK